MSRAVIVLLIVVVGLVLTFDTYVAIIFVKMFCGHDLIRTLLTDMPRGGCS
jgi:hypothetical protein